MLVLYPSVHPSLQPPLHSLKAEKQGFQGAGVDGPESLPAGPKIMSHIPSTPPCTRCLYHFCWTSGPEHMLVSGKDDVLSGCARDSRFQQVCFGGNGTECRRKRFMHFQMFVRAEQTPPFRLHYNGCHGHRVSGTQQQSARVPP